MPNLVDQMGAAYFNEKFATSFFLYNGKVARIINANGKGTSVVIEEFNGPLDEPEEKVVPATTFNGFKVFEYPLLGYRRFGEHLYGFATKRQTSNRGFRSEQITTTWTACTRALIDLGAISGNRLNERAKVISLLQPKFDTIAQLPDLLAGKTSGLVINNNVMIEPATDTQNDWYSILYKQARVGKINQAGKITWNDPAFANIVVGLE
jgi:hypothetical protein